MTNQKSPAEAMAESKPVQMRQSELDAGLGVPATTVNEIEDSQLDIPEVEPMPMEAGVDIVPGETVPEAGTMDEAGVDINDGDVQALVEESTAVAVPEQTSIMSSEEAMAHAQIAIAGGLGGSQNQYETAMKIIRGHELGIPPAAAVENIYVVNNKTSMGAGLIAAIIKKSGLYNYRVIEHDNQHCKIQFFEKDWLSGQGWIDAGISEFSIDDAKAAGVVKPSSPWITYPRNMVFARALTNGARWYCPDIFQGSIYTDEELQSVQVAAPVAAQQPIAGAPVAPAAIPAPQSTPSTTAAPAAAPAVAPIQGAEYLRPPYVDGVEWGTEECPLHFNDAESLNAAIYKGQAKPVNFFKGGRMKSHAHNAGQAGWCNRQDVIKNLREQVETAAEGYEQQFEVFIGERFPDISAVDRKNWRAGDWFEILQHLQASNLAAESKPPADPEAEAVVGDTGESLPV
jgi:hypothetical protein